MDREVDAARQDGDDQRHEIQVESDSHRMPRKQDYPDKEI